MKTAARALLALVLAGAPAAAAFPEGYPGAVWGNAVRDFSGFEGYASQGWVRQGVRWGTLPGGVGVQTAAAYNWRVRTENRRFYDAHGPGVILELDKAFLTTGAELSWQRYPRLGRTDNKREFFLGWYKRVPVFKAGGVAFPLAAWGRVSRDLNGFEGTGSMGWFSFGPESPKLPGGFVARAMASYRWRLRTQERLFYNVHGPAVGVELSGHHVDIGLENIWRDYGELHRRERALQAYVGWFLPWDFARR